MQFSATQATPPGLVAPTAALSSDRWRRLLDLDCSRGWAAVLLALIYLASHAPWLSLGYGADPDAWRVAMSARYLLEHASYLPSRLPGYPVHDIAMAVLLWGGWTLTNSATLFVSLVGVWLFARIVRQFALPARGLLTVTFAFLPLLWSTSTATLDYSWALTLLLGAYLAQLRGRPVVAGLLLGLAGGCRVSYLAFSLPLALLFWQGGSIRPPARFIGTTLATWLVVFSPIWVRYGTQFWNFYDVRPSWGDFLRALTEASIGLLPLIVLLLALALSWRRVLALPTLLRTERQAAAWASIVLLTLFVFVRLPLQTYYLMPVAPFGLLLLARVLRPSLLVAVCVALVIGGYVDFYTASTGGWRTPAALLHIRPTAGIVLQDYQLRKDRLELVRGVRHIELPAHSVLTAGFYFPMVAELYHDQLTLTLPEGYLFEIGPLTDNARATDDRGVTYVWLLPQGEARNFIREGYDIYSLDFSRATGAPIPVRIYQPENERFGIH